MMRAMSTQPRADLVLPYKLARQQGRWQGSVALEKFERLPALVVGAGGSTVDVVLGFRRDEEGRCRVDGSARVSVGLECGRCLLPQPCTVAVTIALCVVGSDADAAALDLAFDPYVLEGEEVCVSDLIEDDLILGLPHRVCPDEDHCPHRPPLGYGAPTEAGAETRNNPFAALAGQFGKRR
jgi:uncharacterized metal-binding protein YceD (DUF177 family)